GGPFDAMEELDSIVQTTESATSNILTAAEQVQEIAWTMRESGSVEALCDELDARATEIYTACSFQDLTGQRTRKVIQLLRYLEDRINTVVNAGGKLAPPSTPASEPSFISSRLVQAGVDAVMQPGQNDRQDATLEDISRLMLAIEPMIGSQHAESSEQRDATLMPAGAEVRPQLSVSETVLAEADAARRLAERTMEPAALPAGTADAEATRPLAGEILEDLAAPQPEAELASKILRRLEAELEKIPEAEAETQKSALVPSPPIPPAPAVPTRAEAVTPSPSAADDPELFLAEAMSQLAQTLRPVPPLPPGELVFRAKPMDSADPLPDPLAELESAMAAAEIKLLQSDQGTEAPAAVAPEIPAAQAAVKEASPYAHANGKADSDPAAITPAKLPPEAGAKQPKSDASHDPLAPLRAMSEAQKIALFS
ncbi:MAG TPA: hypothetical protein VHK44_05480, partial [Xanthobacteraceae bacterium]|nr:hypothetical protein [Xanthobacteraceae bacterium]